MAQVFKTVAPMGCQPINELSSTQNHTLGLRVHAKDVSDNWAEFVYLKTSITSSVGHWHLMDLDSFTVGKLAANDIGPVGVGMAAGDGTAQYGWFCIFGKVEAQMAASFADDGNIYTTATAGVCDDAVVAGDRVKNAYGAETITGAGLCEVRITYPFVDDGLAA